MATHETPRRPSPLPLSSPGNSSLGSPPRSELRSRPSTLSFASLAPSDSRSNAPQSVRSPGSPTRSEATVTTVRPSGRRLGKARSVRSTPKPAPMTQIAAGTRIDDVDLLKVKDVDVLFQTFTIREVRELERKAQVGAARKQEELRQMVGERYRDLLGAADSIVRMSTGSGTLLQKLQQVGHDCSKEEMARTSTAVRERTLASSVASSSKIPYTLATLVKLLVDLPTHIWRALDASDFLLAARFESLGRVVYRELASGKWTLPDSPEGEPVVASPVVTRHWQALGQLGPQIIRRSKMMLRRGDGSLDQVAETLAALILLDNLSAPEALDLLLFERQGALDALFQAAEAKSESKGVVSRVELIGSAVRLFATTLEQAADCFGSERQSSKLVRLLEELQRPPPADSLPDPQASPTQRRATLVSARRRYSLVNGNATLPPNVPPILSLLPNPQTVLRHLPESISAHSPFIDVTPARNAIPASDGGMPSPAQQWYLSGRRRLLQLLFPLISDVETIQQLASLRTSLRSTFQATGSSADRFRRELADLIDEDLENRFATLHQQRLDSLRAESLLAIKSAMAGVQAPAEPNDFLFADVLPSLQPAITLSKGQEPAAMSDLAFEEFATHIRHRVEGRYPPAAGVARAMEGLARALREDLESWAGGKGLERFLAAAKDVYDRLEEDLTSLFAHDSPSVAQQVFVGDVALLLAAKGSFERDLALGLNGGALSKGSGGMSRIAAMPLGAWQSETTTAALQAWTAGLGDGGMGDGVEEVALWKESQAGVVPAGPSDGASAAVTILARALVTLGPNRIAQDPVIVRSLVSSFLARAQESVPARPQRSQHAIKKLVWDFTFFCELAKANACLEHATAQTVRALQEQLLHSADVATLYLQATEVSAQAYLRRTQNLFGPLLLPAHDSSEAKLMPLGPADPADFRSLAVVVKPGPRFVMLPVGSLPRR